LSEIIRIVMNDYLASTTFIEETTSTNIFAKDLLKKRQTLPFAVQAEFQTKGKGQFNKSWESRFGENLLFSIALNVSNIPIEQQFKISQIVAVSIRNIVAQYVQNVSIKWPNDIYVENCKIAGILIENTIIGQQLDSCIVGIGLNINQTIFSQDLPNPTSLKKLTSKEYDRDLIRNKIIDEIFKHFNEIENIGNLYDKYLYRKGELNQFKDEDDSVFLGVILGVDAWGKLQIRLEDNQIKFFTNNEVKMILPVTSPSQPLV